MITKKHNTQQSTANRTPLDYLISYLAELVAQSAHLVPTRQSNRATKQTLLLNVSSNGKSYGSTIANNLAPQISSRLKQKRKSASNMKSSYNCLLYTSPSPRDGLLSRMPSSA